MSDADGVRRPGRSSARTAALARRLTGGELEAYLVSGTALVVGALGLLNVTSPDVVAAATLAVLGVITFDLLTGRRRLRRVESVLRGVADGLRPTGAGSVDPLLTAAAPEAAVLAGARDIRLVGVTLSRTIRSQLDVLRQQLADGATVRVALIDPTGPAPEEAARRNGLDANGGEVFARRVQPTIDLLDYLAAQATGGGRLEVRLLHFVPAFGMVLVDPEDPTGRISIDIYSHRPDGREATVTLRADRDPVWCRHFVREFDRVWAAGRSGDDRSRA
ncbi:hypothetical protein [Micromonospora carbonacea]|uniref:Uncharacterized protein n=1 Tax=Micromonospora carbonacea TaxID=47853 RepID=A0A1C5A563_9ACTN|nr:hypothetical protein [Micromonospora carbonacea]SCF40174.1 hypothetical protein GA0070563_111116 [Micromonospora carbonacea]